VRPQPVSQRLVLVLLFLALAVLALELVAAVARVLAGVVLLPAAGFLVVAAALVLVVVLVAEKPLPTVVVLLSLVAVETLRLGSNFLPERAAPESADPQQSQRAAGGSFHHAAAVGLLADDPRQGVKTVRVHPALPHLHLAPEPDSLTQNARNSTP
jgi:hypothetical protein